MSRAAPHAIGQMRHLAGMLILLILLLLLLLPLPAAAQSAPDAPMPMHHMHAMSSGGPPTQAGQAAFAAIQDIVQQLEADPATDWSRVDIEALRQHLIDMDNVTLHAVVTSEPVEGGLRFTVTGEGAVRDSIRRMTAAHAAAMNGHTAWHFAAADTPDGATLTVTAPPQDAAKLRALGFIGILTEGMHHQMHHLMIAQGLNPH